MHTAQPLDGDYLPVLDVFTRKLYRVALKSFTLRVEEEHLRPADGAAVGLSVIAPVLDIVVFPVAVGTHGELAHRGLAAVVWHVLYNSKARTAVGAVYKRIFIPPVVPVAQLTQTIVTDADIRRDERIAEGLGLTFKYFEIGIILELRRILGLDALYHGKLGRAQRQRGGEALQRIALTLKLQLNAGGGVFNKSAQTELLYKLMYKGAEAHTLHDAVYFQLFSFQDSRSPVAIDC